jgi:hypothetical protein
MAAKADRSNDKAMPAFAFASWQVESGRTVSSGVQHAGAGDMACKMADGTEVGELKARGDVRADGRSLRPASSGDKLLEPFIQSLNRALDGGSQATTRDK